MHPLTRLHPVYRYLLLAGVAALCIYGFVVIAGAQHSPASLYSAWILSDGTAQIAISVPAGRIPETAELQAGAARIPLTVKMSSEPVTYWLVLDAGETMLNLYPAVSAAVRRFLDAEDGPAGILLVDSQIRLLEPTASHDELGTFLDTYIATAGQPACIADALRMLADRERSPGILWRVLLITGGKTPQTTCETTRLPELNAPVDVLTTNGGVDAALSDLAGRSGGVSLTADLRRIETRLNDIQTRWHQTIYWLTGALADTVPADLSVSVTFSDGRAETLRLNPVILPTATPTATGTATPAPTPTATPTVTETPLPTATETPTATATATTTMTATATATSTDVPTVTPAETATASATVTTTATATITSMPTATATDTPDITEEAAAVIPPPQQNTVSGNLTPLPGGGGSTLPITGSPLDNSLEIWLIVVTVLAVTGWLAAFALYFRIPRVIPMPQAAMPERSFYDSLEPRRPPNTPPAPALAAPVPPPPATLNTDTQPSEVANYSRRLTDPLLTNRQPSGYLQSTPPMDPGTRLIGQTDMERMMSRVATDTSIAWIRLESVSPPIDYQITLRGGVIGRAPDCEVHIPNDSTVLPYHARLQVSPDGHVTFINLDLDEPPYVNNRLVLQSQVLQPGDFILLTPRTRLVFMRGTPQRPQEKTQPWSD